MEMLNPDARKQLKSMLEHQIQERHKSDQSGYSPGKLKALQIREENLTSIQQNRMAFQKPPISKFNLYGQANVASLSQLPPLHQNTSTPTHFTAIGRGSLGASPLRGGAQMLLGA